MSQPESNRLPQLSGRSRWRLGTALITLVALAGAALGVGILVGFVPNPLTSAKPAVSNSSGESHADRMTVKVVSPKLTSLPITADMLAVVEPYYRADLRARASGIVRTVTRNIGDKVRKGEVLIEIDVPESVQEVAQKVAGVEQRIQEVRVSRALLKDAEAKRAVAAATIRQRDAEVAAAVASSEFRKKRLDRYRGLAAKDTIGIDVLEEQEKEFKAGEAAVLVAQAGVERANADLKDAETRIEAAAADIDLKSALVEVARRDLDRSRAVADFGRITAPFDGVIVRRAVDPGSFVQNATTGSSDALISVARTDFVTVVARVPDNAAPFVTDHTEATLDFDNVADGAIVARVTRFAPSINAGDRTTQVEIDLFNGDEKDFAHAIGPIVSAGLAPLSPSLPGPSGWSAATAATNTLGQLADLGVDVAHIPTGRARLLPGVTGTMRLKLRDFGSGAVLPSTAVYSITGKPYILVVEAGRTKQLPVRVQVNDGRVVKVTVLVRRGFGDPEANVELTGREQVIASRQLEIGEGRAVAAVLGDW